MHGSVDRAKDVSSRPRVIFYILVERACVLLAFAFRTLTTFPFSAITGHPLSPVHRKHEGGGLRTTRWTDRDLRSTASPRRATTFRRPGAFNRCDWDSRRSLLSCFPIGLPLTPPIARFCERFVSQGLASSLHRFPRGQVLRSACALLIRGYVIHRAWD